MRRKIVAILRKNLFKPGRLGVIINPYFIARRSLFLAIQHFARTLGSGKTILDVGCGGKPYAALFNHNTYIGIDIEGGGHADHAKKVDQYFDGVHIPYSDESVSGVVCTQVLEHSADPEILLGEMYRVLAPGGIIFLTVPFVWPEHEKPYDFQRYTSYGLDKLCKSAGFESIRIETTTGIYGTVSQLLAAHMFENWTTIVWLKALVVVCICFPVQVIGLLGDALFRHTGMTLDYVVTARKV